MGALFFIAILAFTAVVYYSFAGMQQIMSTALNYGDRLGEEMTRDSRTALMKRIHSDLTNTAADQSRIVDLLLDSIAAEVTDIMDAVISGRIYLGSGDPKLFLPGNASPSDPGKYSLCHFPPGTSDRQRTDEVRSQLSAAIPFLTELKKSSPFIGGTALILADGGQLFYPWRPLPADFDARKKPWYQQTVAAKGEACWYDVGSGTAICARAAYGENGSLLGVAAVEIPVEGITKQVTALRSGYLSFLADAGGRMISGLAEFRKLSGSPAELQQKIKAGQTGVFQLKSGGEPLIATFYPVPHCGWHLVICQPETIAFKDIRDMNQRLAKERNSAQDVFQRHIYSTIPAYAVILTGILAVILLLGYLLARQLTRPISTLIMNAHDIGSGHLDRKIKLHTGDELEQLANTINQMADDLTRYIRNLNQAAADRQRVESELRTAAEIQAAMLPDPALDRPNVGISAIMRPAREVGGDLYDFFFVDPTHLFFAIGDVSGKGIPAALFMATATTLMRGFARNALSPSEILQQTNNLLEKKNENCMFITVCCGLLDCVTGEVVCCNAGHNLPAILKPDGNCSLLRLPAGFPLGPFPQEKPEFYAEERLQMQPGDTLVLYTDGVTEAFNEQNQQFGSARLQLALSAAPPAKNPLAKVMDSLLRLLQEFTGEVKQSDDLTVLMVQFKGAGAK